MTTKTPVNSDKSLEAALELVRQSYAQFGYIELDIKVQGKKRSGQQRKALEVYCKEMADALNDAGVDYVKWLEFIQSNGVQAVWTQDRFKDAFRQYAGALFPEIISSKGNAETSKLTRPQMTQAYDLVNMRMSTYYGVGMNWPSED